MDSLIAKLDELDQRYVDIEAQISDPEIACDIKKVVPLAKEQGKLRVVVEKYRKYKGLIAGIDDARLCLTILILKLTSVRWLRQSLRSLPKRRTACLTR